jgi:hypothetical protein
MINLNDKTKQILRDDRMNGREILSVIYDKFYLRDLFGKMVPGLIFIGATYTTANYFCLVPDIKTDIFLVIVLLGISWILGFCMQSFGEWIKLIRYFPKSETRSEFYVQYLDFLKKATMAEKENVERLVVIKEACGNFCSAILVTSIFVHLIILNICGFGVIIDYIWSLWSLYVIIIFIFIFLFRMHREHVNRQTEFMKAVLSDKGEGTTENSQK